MRRLLVWCLSLLFLFTLFRGVLIGVMPLSPDEAYYWIWSEHLAWGYLDHPAMVAWWIKVGTSVFGNSLWGIRLLAPLSAFVSSLLLAFAVHDFFSQSVSSKQSENQFLRVIYLSMALLGLGVEAVTMTPDTPLLFFLCCTLWALGRLLTTHKGLWWLVVGLCLGLALDSKYTALLWGLSLAFWLVASKAGRQWLFTPWPWLGGIVCIFAFSPTLWWNSQHEWASFLRQGGRTASWQPERMVQFLLELLAGQIGLMTPVVGVGFVVSLLWLWRTRRENPNTSLLFWLILLPVGVFVQHAFGDRVQANWPLIVYPACIIILAAYPWKWFKAGVISGLVITTLVYVQAGWAVFPLPRAVDITIKRLAGWPALAIQLESLQEKSESRFILADDYGVASLLAFYIPHSQIIGVDPRWRYFDVSHCDISGEGLFVQSANRSTFPKEKRLIQGAFVQDIERRRYNIVAEKYRIYHVMSQHHDTAEALLSRACLAEGINK